MSVISVRHSTLRSSWHVTNNTKPASDPLIQDMRHSLSRCFLRMRHVRGAISGAVGACLFYSVAACSAWELQCGSQVQQGFKIFICIIISLTYICTSMTNNASGA